MKLLILGAGAVGGYFGARLAQANKDVTFLARKNRADKLLSSGLKIKSELGNFNEKVKVITKNEINKNYDLIILTCKSYSLNEAIEDIKPAFGDNSTILPLINGIDHYDRLNNKFGEKNVLGGYCFINSILNNEGDIIHNSKKQTIVFGDQNNIISDKCLTIENLLADTTLDYELSKNIMHGIWNKFVFMSTVAATTCLMRADIGTILKMPGGQEIIVNIFNECTKTAEAAGYSLRKDYKTNFIDQLSDVNSNLRASMLTDIENNTKTEADHIIGSIIKHASEYNIPVPLLKTAYCHLKCYEVNRT